MSNWIRIESPLACKLGSGVASGPMDVNLDNAYFNFPIDEGDGVGKDVVAQIIMMNGMPVNVTKLPEEWKRFGRKVG